MMRNQDSQMKRGSGPYGRMGFPVRIAYLGLASICWLWSCLLRGSRNRGWIVLCYHSVTSAQADRFYNQLLKLSGRTVSVDQIGCGKPGVCLTFDDAFACLLENVIPPASQLGIPLAIFPVTENLNATPRWQMPEGHRERGLRTMSAEELIAIRDNSLITIGSHTATHQRLGDVMPDVVTRELQSSRDSLAQILSKAPQDIALPHGSFNSQVCEEARRTGYRRVFTLEPMVNTQLPADGRVGRFSVDPDMWMIEFQLTAAGAYSYLFPFRRVISQVRLRATSRSGRSMQSQHSI